MYAIVKTGGKQYRVEEGQTLLVERLPGSSEGEAVTLDPLLYVDGNSVVDGEELAKVSVSARIMGHERGPKLRIVKFKPKRGYKRRTGHRQELTRIEVTAIKLAARRPRAKKAEAEGAGAAAPSEATAAASAEPAAVAPKRPRRPKASAEPTTEGAGATTAEADVTPSPEEEGNGA